MSTPTPPAPADRPAWLSYALGAALVVIAVVLFAVLRGGDDNKTPAAGGATGVTGVTTAPRPKPVAATPASLTDLSKSSKRPVYWAGRAPAGGTYELTQTPDGSVYVRYLDRGVALGDARPNFLTVGTYPQSDPFKTVRDAAKRPGARTEKLPRGGLAVANKARPNSWYEAYPGAEVLVEVFAPKAARARELVRSGRIVPVKG